MLIPRLKLVGVCALVLTLSPMTGAAQTSAAPGQSVVVAKPTYIFIPLEITVNKPAADVWKRIGRFCGIKEWLPGQCTILSGKEDELGAVRSVGNEVLVGKTDLSYTYAQTPSEGRAYNLYHATLEAKPMGPNLTKLVYTLVYDNSMLPDDAAREKDRASRAARFQGFLNNMKILAEGGQLPPRPQQ